MYDIAEDCDVAHVKTSSASYKNKELEAESSNSQQKKKVRETNLMGRHKKKHSQRKIKIDDMPMWKGVEPFTLKQEITSSGEVYFS